MSSRKVSVLSFSGIDGAGKSTQIEAVCKYLRLSGLRVRVYTFWDDVVVFPTFRERMSLLVFKGDRGVGRPDRPIVRRDKNVGSASVVSLRLLLYLLDALHTCVVAYRAVNDDVDVAVFDRYIYDELANLPLRFHVVRRYVHSLLKLVPQPDIRFLVDADPEDAFARKPEYPVEFVRRNREAYLNLARFAGMTVLPPRSIEETGQTIQKLIATHKDGELKPFASPEEPGCSRAGERY